MIDEQSFDTLHGKGAFAKVCRLLQGPMLTYAEIGRELKLTRQRISQLAQLVGINGRRRERERIKHRPPCVVNKRAEYSFTVRLMLGELERRGISVAPYYTVDRRRRVAHKDLRMMLVNGAVCKVGYRNTKKGARFTPFHVTPRTRQAKAVVWGVRHGSQFRLYVIPLSELKNVTCSNIPVTGAYIRTSRQPIRDWTIFENAWHLLREGVPKHSNPTTKSKRFSGRH
jgi:hypothetical protein